MNKNSEQKSPKTQPLDPNPLGCFVPISVGAVIALMLFLAIL